jgi:hypothetical protein
MTPRKLVYTVTIEDGDWIAQIPVIGGVIAAPTLARLKASVIHGTEFIFEGEEVEIGYVYDLPLEEVTPSAKAGRPDESTLPGHLRRKLEAVRTRLKELITADVTESDAAEVMGISPQYLRQLKST